MYDICSPLRKFILVLLMVTFKLSLHRQPSCMFCTKCICTITKKHICRLHSLVLVTDVYDTQFYVVLSHAIPSEHPLKSQMELWEVKSQYLSRKSTAHSRLSSAEDPRLEGRRKVGAQLSQEGMGKEGSLSCLECTESSHSLFV